jgi:hypothetical protein
MTVHRGRAGDARRACRRRTTHVPRPSRGWSTMTLQVGQSSPRCGRQRSTTPRMSRVRVSGAENFLATSHDCPHWSVVEKPLLQKGFRADRDDARPSVIGAAQNATHNDERCHLNDALSVCTMASDHCGLLRTPSVEPARYRLQWKSYRFFVEKLAHERSRVHSDDMSNSGGGQYYWCLRHNRVETDADVCPASKTMGPMRPGSKRSRH